MLSITDKEWEEVDRLLDWLVEKQREGWPMVNSIPHLRNFKLRMRGRLQPWIAGWPQRRPHPHGRHPLAVLRSHHLWGGLGSDLGTEIRPGPIACDQEEVPEELLLHLLPHHGRLLQHALASRLDRKTHPHRLKSFSHSTQEAIDEAVKSHLPVTQARTDGQPGIKIGVLDLPE